MPYIQDINDFMEKNRPFFGYLKEMEENLKPISLDEIIKDAGGENKTALISVDLIEGFCRTGVLASDRIAGIIPASVELVEKAYNKGIRHIALVQDSHPDEALEFNSFPPHCTKDSEESLSIREFRDLPFYNEMAIITKNSVNSFIDTDLEKWLMKKALRKIIIIGDCTDLCTYHLAMSLRFFANSMGLPWEVIVPANAVETYDMPVDTAKQFGAVPHPGDLMHMIFLYHLMLNGVKVVKSIED
ncbi:MAG: cysteine hydrolase [Firmicutes bacterium]|nr:cysteine hydrolase [Bacillota bacterium]